MLKCTIEWELWYRMIYLEHKMHNYQFNHGSWCLHRFQQIQVDLKIEQANRYYNMAYDYNKFLAITGRNNEPLHLDSYEKY